LHKFVSRSRLTNGKQGYGLLSHGHWLAWLSDRDNNIELSIYISTLILEYFGGSIETWGLIVVVSHSLGFSRLSSHSGCRILTPRSIWGVIIVCELHGFLVVISVRSLRNDILSGIVLPARQHLDCLCSASLAGHSCCASLMSQEALWQLGTQLVLHASIVGFFISESN
jgi:hypothetical protein